MIKLDPAINLFLAPAECKEFINAWMESRELHCLLIHPIPFDIQVYEPQSDARFSEYQEAWLDMSPFTIQKDYNSLAISNRGCLLFRFPFFGETVLVEGSIGSIAENDLKQQLWSELARCIFEKTTEGMWVYNLRTGKLSFTQTHRYSEEAAHLSEQGVVLRAESGYDLFFPNKPTPKTIELLRMDD